MSWRGILSIEDVTEEINRFASDRDWDQFHTPKNIASSISIEAAELLECFQWNDPTVPDVLVDEELLGSVEEEIADVLIYALRLCSILDLDAISSMRKKLELNHEKYPLGISRGRSNKHDKL